MERLIQLPSRPVKYPKLILGGNLGTATLFPHVWLSPLRVQRGARKNDRNGGQMRNSEFGMRNKVKSQKTNDKSQTNFNKQTSTSKSPKNIGSPTLAAC
jgi:hypothetical protein